jgi:hypothetical protein
MANKTLTITAPEELMQPTILAYADMHGVTEGTPEELEAAAIAALKNSMREVTLNYAAKLRRQASILAEKAQREAEEAALSAAAPAVVIEFN